MMGELRATKNSMLVMFDVYPVVVYPCSFFQLYFMSLWQQIKSSNIQKSKVHR